MHSESCEDLRDFLGWRQVITCLVINQALTFLLFQRLISTNRIRWIQFRVYPVGKAQKVLRASWANRDFRVCPVVRLSATMRSKVMQTKGGRFELQFVIKLIILTDYNVTRNWFFFVVQTAWRWSTGSTRSGRWARTTGVRSIFDFLCLMIVDQTLIQLLSNKTNCIFTRPKGEMGEFGAEG